MAFKHCILFATILAANFGCDWFRITPDIVSKLLCSTIWRHPCFWTGRQFRSAALHRIEFGTCGFVLCHIFTQRPMTYRKIERSDGRCFGRQQLLAKIENFISHKKLALTSCQELKISFHIKRSDSLLPKIYKALKLFWFLDWVSIARVVDVFLKRACRCQERLQQTRKRPVFVLACPTRPSSAGERPEELCKALWARLPATAFGEIARWSAGAQTWTQTRTLPPDQRVVSVLSPPISQHKQFPSRVWIHFLSVTDAKFEPNEVRFLMLMPETA